MGVALFDFDRTLIDVNSGTLWLRHEVRAGRVTWRDAVWATWWFTRYHLGLASGLDAAFEQAVAAYKGMTDTQLRGLTERFFHEQIVAHLRPGARAALDHHRERGDRMALCSSTTQYLAELACETWGLEVAARTELEVQDGVLTGRIASLALGDHKTDRTLEWARTQGVDLADATFYTDSFTDAKLMEAVGSPVAVHPDRQLGRLARRRGWRVVDWGRAGPAS